MPRPRAFAVAGSPVLHSASPSLFRAAFASLGLDAVYTRLSAPCAEEVVCLARGIGLSGFNVTAPFKEGVAGLCDALDPAAEALGAVNTVVFEGGVLRGCNTDADGVVAALERASVEIRGSRALVLGAGGAGRAAAFGLRRAGASEVAILARDPERARRAAACAACDSGSLEEAPRRATDADILVSCLPPGASRAALPLLRPGLAVLDANYHDPELSLAAVSRGCAVARGGDWLVGQAERAFRLFTGIDSPDGIMETAFCGRLVETRPEPWPIALSGLSGSGKSSVAPLLAAHLGRPLRDTDAMAEAEAGASVREIFERLGEAEFRRLERGAVSRALNESAVVALGGGALIDEASLARVRSACLTVWLWTDPGVAGARAAGGSRPLLSGGADPAALLEVRMPGYLRAADLVVATEGHSPDDIAQRIADEARRSFPG